MSRRAHSGLQVLLLLAAAAQATRAQPAAAKPDPTRPRVLRVLTVSQENQGPKFLVCADPMEVSLPLKFAFSDAMQRRLISLNLPHRFRLVKLTAKPVDGSDGAVVALDAYTAPPELASRRAWLFRGVGDEKVAGQTLTVLKLSKYDVDRTVLLPTRPSPVAGGKPVADPPLLERLNAFNTGDVIEVELQPSRSPAQPPMLLDADVYRAPRAADFVKLENVKAGGKVLPGVTLNTADGPQSFLLPPAGAGALPSAVTTLANARKFKPGDAVLFTARDSAGAGAPPALRDLFPEARVETSFYTINVVAPYATIVFSVAGDRTQVGADRRYGRPDEFAFDNGVRLLSTYPDRAAKAGIAPDVGKKLEAVWRDFDRTQAAIDLTPQERRALTSAFDAWRAARDEAQRDRAAQQLCWAAAELSQRGRREMTSAHTIYRGLLTADQAQAALTLGGG